MLLQRREELTPAQANAVNRILRSAARIDALAGLLIDFTYARLGKGIPARASAMDARAIVERAIDELRETNPGREIRLESNAAALSGSWDPDRVSQLLSNLVSNALQYGARDAPVTVSLSRDAAGALEVRVHNQGPAIAAGLRQHLFEPHRRSEGAESAHPRGLGLGRAIHRPRDRSRAWRLGRGALRCSGHHVCRQPSGRTAAAGVRRCRPATGDGGDRPSCRIELC